MPGPFRLLQGPAGDLWVYASTTPASDSRRAHVVLCHDLPRPKGSAADVALTFPALADRLTRESGRSVVIATLRGAGGSAGDFSPLGWLDDLAFVAVRDCGLRDRRLLVSPRADPVVALGLADPLPQGLAHRSTH